MDYVFENDLETHNYDQCKNKTCIRKCCSPTEFVSKQEKCIFGNFTKEIYLKIYDGKELIINPNILFVTTPDKRNIVTAPKLHNFEWCSKSTYRLEI